MKKEEGFTLVEVLASLVIISIILMSFMAIFSNTNKLAVSNSEKLVVINLADAYLERVKIDPIGTIQNEAYNSNQSLSEVIDLPSCPLNAATKTKICQDVVLSNDNTKLNGKQYNVVIQFSQSQAGASSGAYSEKELQLIDVLVTVSSPDSGISSSVEGYIADEKTNSQ